VNKRNIISMILFVSLLIITTVSYASGQSRGAILPTFGTGAVQVRIYTDYFCPPCRGMEPSVEPLLRNLIDKKVIQLTFIDTPFNPHSPLYARYYLYAWKAKSDFEHALMARNALFGAAAGNLATADREIEKLFKGRGIPYAAFDAKQIFKRYNDLIREDKINQTPSCVIIRKGKKETFVGGASIIKALKGLM
jgi:protein-disulfide isomerase